MQSGPPADPVESVTVQLAELEITVSVRRRASESPSAISALSGASESGHSGNTGVHSTTAAWSSAALPRAYPIALEAEALACTTARAFADLRLDHLPSDHRLRATGSEWTPAARLGRAFKAGVIARSHLDDRSVFEESPAIPFRNQYYIVLRGSSDNTACWTTNFAVYSSRVFVNQGGVRAFASQSVSHAFASRAECIAYLSGARVEWPPEASQ